jgi:hypothetical protein
MSSGRPDPTPGQALRDAGIGSVAARNVAVLGALKNLARNLAWAREEISVNDLREAADLPADTTPLVFAAVFRGKEWEPCGYTTAAHPQAHARTVRLYRLRREHGR